MPKKIPCGTCGHATGRHTKRKGCSQPGCKCAAFVLQPSLDLSGAKAEAPEPKTDETFSKEAMKVIEGVELSDGAANISDETMLAQVQHAVRLGHPQVWMQPARGEIIALVGGGPSINNPEVLAELTKVIQEGAVLVTVNGAYKWCLDHNLHPRAQVVVDGRASNAKFVDPEIPNCRYYLGSQCHADTWAKVQDREFVGIFHPLGPEDEDTPIRKELDSFYLKNWQNIAGGTTVATRAIGLCRQLGYLRFHLFGIDSCWLNTPQTEETVNHAYPQPENDKDRRMVIGADPEGEGMGPRDFVVSPWHLKQLEDFLRFIKMAGDNFLLNVHGDGLLAYALKTHAHISLEEEQHGSASMDRLQPGEKEDWGGSSGGGQYRPGSDDVPNLTL